MIDVKVKKNKLWIFCFMGISILFIPVILLGCEDDFNKGTAEYSEGIKSIILSFDGDPVESYSYILTEEENINEAMRIYEKLKTYKSPKIKTWFEDVTYEIEGIDGKIKTTTFKKVRPVSDLYNKIFNSLEVRKQAVPILTIDISEIGKLEMFSAKKGERVVYKDRDNIEQLILSLKEYYSSDKVLNKDKYTLVEVELFNNNDEYIGNGFIFRDDTDTQNILDKQGNLNNLIVTPRDIKSMQLTQGETKIKILDINIMQVVLDNYLGYHTSDSIISVEYYLKETKAMRLDWHGSFLKDVVPKEIESLFDR